MQKISITLDAVKLRNLVSKRNYTNKEGQEVVLQEVKFDLVELADDKKKVVYTAEKYVLEKTHFAVAQQTKDEREAKTPAVFVGEGISMKWINEISNIPVHDAQVIRKEDEDDLPF
jgi:hypothetical protein